MDWYNIFKWLHIVSIICWMAGILYLYRLLVNHRNLTDKACKELLEGMERRLYYFITLPSLKIAYLAGFGMVGLQHQMAQQKWFIIKFTCVIFLTLATIYAGKLMKKAKLDLGSLPSSKALRWLNELPTLLMLIIVWAVVFKPE